MRIDWNWGQPARASLGRRVRNFLRFVFTNTNVPLHMSDHYNKSHFDQK